MKQILGSFILCYVFAVKARKECNITWLYIVYFLLLIFAWYYAYNNIFALIEFGEERLNDSKLNANTLGVFSDLIGTTNKPDYSSINLIQDATNRITPIDYTPIGTYLSYNPFDKNFYSSEIYNQHRRSS